MAPIALSGSYSGGSGTTDDPYLISTAAQLIELGQTPDDYGACFRLIADLDMAGAGPNADGSFPAAVIAPDTNTNDSDYQGTGFTGHLNGAGHVIGNLTLYSGQGDHIGLFGNLGWSALVENLVLDKVVLTGGFGYSGGLCGLNSSASTIRGCVITASANGLALLGGLCGENEGTISDCRISCTVTGTGLLGGLCGENRGGSISNCSADGSVTGGDDSQCLGILCGLNSDGGSIVNSHASGRVSGQRGSLYMGGLCGRNTGDSEVLSCFVSGADLTGVEDCHEIGGLVGSSDTRWCTINSVYVVGVRITAGDGSYSLGGLCGLNSAGTIAKGYAAETVVAPGSMNVSQIGAVCGTNNGQVQDCFWDRDTCNLQTSAGGVSKTTAQMKTLSTYTNAYWDFTTIWIIRDGLEYPRFLWEYSGVFATISGHIQTRTGDGVKGITLTFGNAGSAETNSDGYYSKSVPFNWSGTVTPSMNNFRFNPRFRNYSTVRADYSGDDYRILLYSGGTGEPADPYRISTVADWQELIGGPANWDRYFAVVNDIDFAGVNLSPVGNQKEPFLGTLEGNGHVFRNVAIPLPKSYQVGLFGNVGLSGRIQNLGIESVSVAGSSDIGGLCGINRGLIQNCSVSGSIQGQNDIGGLCGRNWGPIQNCSVSGSIQGSSSHIGGLCGESDSSAITSCHTDCEVQVGHDGSGGGGLCGRNFGPMTDCSATGAVTGGAFSFNLGGLCGVNDGPLTDCSATGAVTSYNYSDYLGGLCGRNDGSLTNCSATGAVTVGDRSGSIGGLCGLNTATLTDCSATGAVTGGNCFTYFGGLCGLNSGLLVNCSAMGNVTATEGAIFGGLCGANFGGTLTGCRAEGYVFGSYALGGLVGCNGVADIPGTESVIQSCTAIGWVESRAAGVLDSAAGGLVGENWYGSITDCRAISFVFSLGIAGGLVGKTELGLIASCTATGHVSGSGYSGGLVGCNRNGTILNSGAIGPGTGVTVSGGYGSGGLVGWSGGGDLYAPLYGTQGGTISGCFASHTVGDAGSNRDCPDPGPAGGLVGENWSTITDCYATGSVIGFAGFGQGLIAGLIGINRGTITNCYASVDMLDLPNRCCYDPECDPLIEVCTCACLYQPGLPLVGSGTTTNSFWDSSKRRGSDGFLEQGTRLTPAQMKTLGTFTATGWDFDTVWTMCEGMNYPRLRWQVQPSDWVCPEGVGLEDLVYLAGRWMAATPEAAGAADANGDGKVDMEDLAILASNWM